MLNERIRKLRMAEGLSQVDLANRLGVSKQSVSNWENDNIQPSIDMVIRLADTLHVSTDYLLGIDQRTYLEVTGLTQSEITHIQLIINDIRKSG